MRSKALTTNAQSLNGSTAPIKGRQFAGCFTRQNVMTHPGLLYLHNTGGTVLCPPPPSLPQPWSSCTCTTLVEPFYAPPPLPPSTMVFLYLHNTDWGNRSLPPPPSLPRSLLFTGATEQLGSIIGNTLVLHSFVLVVFLFVFVCFVFFVFFYLLVCLFV